MKDSLKTMTRRPIAWGMIFAMAASLTNASAAMSQQVASDNGTSPAGVATPAVPSSATGGTSTKVPDYPDAPAPSVEQNPAAGSASSEEAQQQPPAKPVGTAVAPYERPSGVAVSRPAGAVIAPAKQRRARAIFISVGIVVAAGAATGVVMALSHSSPSRP